MSSVDARNKRGVSERSIKALAFDYKRGEISQEALVRKVQLLEHGMGTAAGESNFRRPKNKQVRGQLPVSVSLLKKRLEATIGQHICALWEECGHGAGKCSQPNFYNEAQQYRAFVDPLQRSLAGDHEEGVVVEVLNRIARKQDEKLSALVLEQQTEISKLKYAMSRQKRGEEESLYHQCKLAVSNGTIENDTPACEALLRVLKHCSPAAAFSAPENQPAKIDENKTSAKKSHPLLSSMLSDGMEHSKSNTSSESCIFPGKTIRKGAPGATSLLGSCWHPKERETAKAQASKPVLSHSGRFENAISDTTKGPRERPMRPEDWVRLQRIKNLPQKSRQNSRDIRVAPSDLNGVGQLLPQHAPLRRLMNRPMQKISAQTEKIAPVAASNISNVTLSKVPTEAAFSGISQMLPCNAPLSVLMRNTKTRGNVSDTKNEQEPPVILERNVIQFRNPSGAPRTNSRLDVFAVPKPSDCQGFARFLPNNAPLKRLSGCSCHDQLENKHSLNGERPSWMMPASYTPPFERSEGSTMLHLETGPMHDINACH